LSSFVDLFAEANKEAGSEWNQPDSEEVMLKRIREEFRRVRNIEIEDFNLASGSKMYENFTCVMTSNPSSLIGRLVTDEGLAEFFNLRPDQMSAVMPKIRIFKMVYLEGEDGPSKDVEFIFDGSYDPENIKEMTQNRAGRGSGVALKSFEWELLGTNTAEVDNNIKANLKLYFQNFKDLISAESLETFTLCQRNQNLDAALPYDEANYLDLIFRSQKFGGETGDFNERYYRIKVVLGWTVDKNIIGPGKLFTARLADKINSVGTTLLLSLLSHSIDFREDGTIELDLEYHAAVESMLTGPASNLLQADTDEYSGGVRILNPAHPVFRILVDAGLDSTDIPRLSANDLLALLDSELINLQNELQAVRIDDEDAAAAGESGPTPDMSTESDCEEDPERVRVSEETGIGGWFGIGLDIEQLVEADLVAVNSLRNRIVSETYSRFLRGLINLRGGTGIFYVDVPDAIFSDEPGTVRSAFSRYQRGLDNQTFQIQRGRGAAAGFERTATYNAAMAEALADDDAGEPAGFETPTIGDDQKRIYYFYLGDLLDVALNILKRDGNPQEFGDINMLLGTIFLHLPKFRAAPERPWRFGAEVREADREAFALAAPTALMNMADLPISLNLFFQFFTDRVIARNRTEWTFRTFLQELFSYLIYPSMGTECAERSRVVRPNIDILHVSAYGDENNENRVRPGSGPDVDRDDQGRWDNRMPRVFDQDIVPIATYNGRLSDRKLFHYLILQANNFNSAGRNAMDPESPTWDAQEGIYWLNIGNPRGIVKSIKFKKDDQPGMREARMEREGSIGLGQLRDKYNADITLFGNGLFQPGQLIYLNPTVVGLQSPGFATHLSSVLGIGGYHQIITVDSAISDNTYETILNTLWVGAGEPGCFDDQANPCTDR